MFLLCKRLDSSVLGFFMLPYVGLEAAFMHWPLRGSTVLVVILGTWSSMFDHPRCWSRGPLCLCSIAFLLKLCSDAQLCPTLQPRGLSPPCSSVHGILQARILEWLAIFFSRASSWCNDQIHVSPMAGIFFTTWATLKGSNISNWPTV